MALKYWKIDEFNPEQPYFFYDICFDPKEGSGATPDGSSINYMGVVAFIEPTLFLKLCYKLIDDRGGVSFWSERLPKKDWCISPPSLALKKEDPYGWFVNSHEGRHRTTALKKIGLPLIPVQLFPYDKRARHLNDQFFDDISTLFSEDKKIAAYFRPEYLILDQNVFVWAATEKFAQHKAKEWKKIKPITIETEAQRTKRPGSSDFDYYWSKPKIE